MVGDDADGEEDAVLRHHGRAPGGGEGCAGVFLCEMRWPVVGLAGSPRLNPHRRDGGRMGWGIYVMDGQDRAHLEWPVIEELRRQQSWRKPPVRPSRAFSACPLSSTVLLQPLYKSILKSRN